jgi:energy-coupling factor transporter ATP-binding protein EcfA2
VALAQVENVTFAYPGASRPALDGVSLNIEPGEFVALLGASGSGKSTLLRAFAGLVPHFHGGRFAGRVEVAGRDTRVVRPAELAGTVATLFQEPEDQVVLTRVLAEVTFGLENLGTEPAEIVPRALAALAVLGAEHLADRVTAGLSGGELQRVCLASAVALEPKLLLLDEPSSQLDRDAAEALFDHARAHGCAVVVAEQRPDLPLAFADRVVFLRDGRIVDELPAAWTEPPPTHVTEFHAAGEEVVRLDGVSFAYPGGPPVLVDESLSLRRGEIVALVGPNGIGKTTLGKLAAGLLAPGGGRVVRFGRAAYLPQDPGRYLVEETVLAEVALAAGEEQALRALEQLELASFADRHPRDLSSGERERLAIAIVLAVEPDLLVLDEPTRGVDPERKRELATLLRAQAPARATLVVTHDRHFAAAVADRTVSLGRAEVLV